MSGLSIHYGREKNLSSLQQSYLVGVWETGTSKSPEIMTLVSILFYCAAQNNFNICVQHLPGVDNVIADALSCFQKDRLRRLAPNANLYQGCLASASLHCRLLQCRYNGFASQPVAHTNQA